MTANYVTYDEDGDLTGSFCQEIQPEHEGSHILVTDDVRLNWVLYRANEARDGVVKLPPYVPPVPTEDEIIAACRGVVQRHLDVTALARGYDSILSAVSYADEPAVPRYQEEGIAFRAWRSQVWNVCDQILQQYQSGDRDAPTYEELIADLPTPPVQSH